MLHLCLNSGDFGATAKICTAKKKLHKYNLIMAFKKKNCIWHMAFNSRNLKKFTQI